jgi:hypothetical protein
LPVPQLARPGRNAAAAAARRGKMAHVQSTSIDEAIMRQRLGSPSPTLWSCVGVAAALTVGACSASSTSTQPTPVSSGNYSLRVRLLDKSNPSLTSGPATFSKVGANMVITLWTDSTETAVKTQFTSQGAVTLGAFNADNNPVNPTDFLVIDNLIANSVNKGGTITLTTVTSSEIDGSFAFTDSTYQWEANFAAIAK